MYCVYLLTNGRQRTYIGFTGDVTRRIRQHNGELKGGAKSTRRGRPWRVVCFVEGFDTISEAMSYEWHWKHRARNLRTRLAYVQEHPSLFMLPAE